jgi:UDP-N-acetylglucosamine 2-epimerase (non-hydrolysing)
MSLPPLKIMSVVGARPNFMKIAPFVHAIAAHNRRMEGVRIEHFLVHTGQHYDAAMYHAFFDALNIPAPDVDLGVGSGSHAEQVGRTMIEFEKVVLAQKPDWVVVVGDVNATCACSITAKKHHVRVAHIEAGLRSFDLHMPEEINRMVTDSISDLLFTPDRFADENLRREGHREAQIQFVGNIMIDTLEAHRDHAAALDLNDIIRRHAILSEDGGQRTEDGGQRTVDSGQKTDDRGQRTAVSGRPADRRPPSSVLRPPFPSLLNGGFAVLTMHRPSNVDHKEVLQPLVRLLIDEISAELPLVWSVHPRTRKTLQQFGLWDEIRQSGNIILINPVGYPEMLKLTMSARLLLTDSGGLQEESCVLGTPCITMRETTERPVTLVEHGGVSELTGPDPARIRAAFRRILEARHSPSPILRTPPLWDGKTAERIVSVLCLTASEN